MAESSLSLLTAIDALLEKKRYPALRDILISMNAVDLAALFNEVSDKALPFLFRLLPKELAAETFVEMDTDAQELLIRSFSDAELKDVVDELYVDDAVDLIEEMPANVVRRILRQADPDTRKTINELLKYPEDSAGSIMTTEFVTLRPKMTVEDAIKRIRRTGLDKETVNNCYVTDGERHLLGTISLRTLILAEEDAVIQDIMEDNVISVNTLEDQETVAQTLAKYDFTAVPVTDAENRLVGIVTIDDAIDVLEEEVTEDIAKMAAVTPSDKPYLKTGAFEIWKNRVPWLLLLMVSATFTGMIITRFETALATHAVLTAFIPMLMDTGGNSGSQACVTIIRGISINEIEFRDIVRVIWKEIRVAVLCGFCLAIACFAKIMLIDRMLLHNEAVSTTVALVVCMSMFLTVCLAKFVGSTLPLLAKRLGFDPAVMASPLITTIVDFLSLLVYFSFATALLHIGG